MLGEYGMNQHVMCISGLVVAKVLIFFCVILKKNVILHRRIVTSRMCGQKCCRNATPVSVCEEKYLILVVFFIIFNHLFKAYCLCCVFAD